MHPLPRRHAVTRFLAGVGFLLASCGTALAQPHVDADNGFQVVMPAGWGVAPLKGRMVWHAARNGGTEMPDCGVIVNPDKRVAAVSNDDFIDSQSGVVVLFVQIGALCSKNSWPDNYCCGSQIVPTGIADVANGVQS